MPANKSLTTVNTAELYNFVDLSIQIDKPLLILGTFGVGKSAIVQQVADAENRPLHVEMLSQSDPISTRGLPVASDNDPNGLTLFQRPELLHVADNAILFLDEITSALPAMQAAAYQLVLDRKLGRHKLPKETRLILAGNLNTDNSVVYDLAAALTNRCMVVEFEPDAKEFAQWGAGAGIDPRILAFVRSHPDLLAPPAKTGEMRAARPRTYEMLSKALAAPASKKLDLMSVTAACIGEAAATKFDVFINLDSKVTPHQQIVDDPMRAAVPTANDLAAVYYIGYRTAASATSADVIRCFEYARRLPADGTAVFLSALRARPAVMGTLVGATLKDASLKKAFMELTKDLSLQ